MPIALDVRHGVLGLPPLLNVAREHGLDDTQLLRSVGISPVLLDDPHASVPVERVHALVALILKRTGDAALGLQAGRHYHPSTFGLLGAVAAIAPTMREMVRLFVQYAHLTFTFFAVEFVESGSEGRVIFVDNADVGALRRFYIDRELAFVYETGREFWPERYRSLLRGVDIDYAEPPDAQRYRDFFPCPVRFGADYSAVILDLSQDRSRPKSNALGLTMLKEHLRSFAGPCDDGDGFKERVRREITVAIAAYRTLPELERVAAALGLSERALRRRLTSEGTSFRDLADEVIGLNARRYLRDSQLSVSEVADRLGYAESASFVRAFRRFSGMTPDAFRAGARARRAP